MMPDAPEVGRRLGWMAALKQQRSHVGEQRSQCDRLGSGQSFSRPDRGAEGLKGPCELAKFEERRPPFPIDLLEPAVLGQAGGMFVDGRQCPAADFERGPRS